LYFCPTGPPCLFFTLGDGAASGLLPGCRVVSLFPPGFPVFFPLPLFPPAAAPAAPRSLSTLPNASAAPPFCGGFLLASRPPMPPVGQIREGAAPPCCTGPFLPTVLRCVSAGAGRSPLTSPAPPKRNTLASLDALGKIPLPFWSEANPCGRLIPGRGAVLPAGYWINPSFPAPPPPNLDCRLPRGLTLRIRHLWRPVALPICWMLDPGRLTGFFWLGLWPAPGPYFSAPPRFSPMIATHWPPGFPGRQPLALPWLTFPLPPPPCTGQVPLAFLLKRGMVSVFFAGAAQPLSWFSPGHRALVLPIISLPGLGLLLRRFIAVKPFPHSGPSRGRPPWQPAVLFCMWTATRCRTPQPPTPVGPSSLWMLSCPWFCRWFSLLLFPCAGRSAAIGPSALYHMDPGEQTDRTFLPVPSRLLDTPCAWFAPPAPVPTVCLTKKVRLVLLYTIPCPRPPKQTTHHEAPLLQSVLSRFSLEAHFPRRYFYAGLKALLSNCNWFV